jgi:hypothetical protein
MQSSRTADYGKDYGKDNGTVQLRTLFAPDKAFSRAGTLGSTISRETHTTVILRSGKRSFDSETIENRVETGNCQLSEK